MPSGWRLARRRSTSRWRFGRLALAGRLGIRSVPTRRLWRGALARALNSDVAAYDTLFVELAVRERRPLVTFDARLLAAFPDVATRPNALSVK